MVAVARRTTLTAVVSVAAAVAIAVAVYGRGCVSRSESADSAARQFLTASKAGDELAMYELMSERTQRELREAARLATERVGGSRRFQPVDMIRVEASEEDALPHLTVKSRTTERVVFTLEGEHSAADEELIVVREGGQWRIEVPAFSADPEPPAGHDPPAGRDPPAEPHAPATP